MKPSLSKTLKTSFAWILFVSFTFITGTVNSAAQAIPGRRPPGAALLARVRLQLGASRPERTRPLPSSTPTWSLLNPAINDPDLVPARCEHSAVYDPGSNTMIVFAGIDGNNNLQNDVLLDTDANGSAGLFGGTWSELNLYYPVPPPRIFHTAVYDQTNNRMIVFGGCGDLQCFAPLNDTWVLTNANGSGGTPAWTELNPTGSLPGPRAYQNAVYDATNNRMIIYSGASGGPNFSGLSDVWVLTNANGLGGTPAWTQLLPTGGPPDAVWGSTGVYDPATNTMIVSGGGSGNLVNSVWTLSNANGLGGTPAWTNLIANGAAGSPPVRWSAVAIYDSTINRMTIYGGYGNGGVTNPDFDFQAYGDVWVLTNANGSGGSAVWTQLHPKWEGDGSIQPGPRFWFSGVRDPGTNSLIIFGGATIEATYSSPWVLSHANGL